MNEKLDFYGEASPIPKGCSVGFVKEDNIVKVTVDLDKITLDQLSRAFVEVSTMKVEYDNE